MEETTPSISVLTSLSLVCELKRGFGIFTEMTQTRPSRTSSPVERGILVLEDLVGLGVLVDAAGERGAEAGEVGAAVAVGDGVGEAEDLVVVGIVVLEDHVGEDIVGGLLAVVVEIDLRACRGG